MLATLATHMTANAAARMFGIGDHSVWRTIGLQSVHRCGLSMKRGHDYITLFHSYLISGELAALPANPHTNTSCGQSA